MQSPTHLTMISSAGFGVWDDEHNAEGYIREGAVDRSLSAGILEAMLSTKKLVLEDRFEAQSFRLDASHAIRAQAGGLRVHFQRWDWIYL